MKNSLFIEPKTLKNICDKPNVKILVSNFLKDHRVCMMSVVAALTFKTEGDWIIKDLDSIKTSFPSFLKTIKKFM